MNKDSDKIFDQAFSKLKQGSSKEDVFSKWPAYQTELSPLLSLAEKLSQLPKKEVPQPSMRRKYILAPARTLWLSWVHVSRWAAVSVSAILLLATLGGTGYAAEKSLPGSTLFQVKKIAEHVRLNLIFNQEDKLNFQVALTQQRLSDAQTVINNTQSDPEQKTAALNELAEETKNTVTVLNQSDKTSAQAKNHPLIASLNSISTQQQALIKDVNNQTSGNGNVDKSVINATQANATQVAAIQQYLNTASKDQALVDLASNPAAVSTTGLIEQLSNGSVTVNKQIFNVNDRTIIKDEKGKVITQTDLKIQEPVEVLGDKNDSGFFARQITILSPDTYKGKVKGEQTSVPSGASSTEPVTTPVQTPDNPSTINNDPNTAIGTFIIEDPAPQTDFTK